MKRVFVQRDDVGPSDREEAARLGEYVAHAAGASAPPSRAATGGRCPRGRVRDPALAAAAKDANSRIRAGAPRGPRRTGPGRRRNRRSTGTGSRPPIPRPCRESGSAATGGGPHARARGARARPAATILSPKARLPIWSWFWRKPTKADGGRCADGSPRASPPRCATARPDRQILARGSARGARPAGRHSRRNSRRPRRSGACASNGAGRRSIAPCGAAAGSRPAAAIGPRWRRSPGRGEPPGSGTPRARARRSPR